MFVRIYFLQMAATSLNTLASTTITTSLEFSYNASLALLWSAVKVNVGIICTCIPTFRLLIKLLVPEKGSDRDSNKELFCLSRGTVPDSRNHKDTRQPSSRTDTAAGAGAVDLGPECAVDQVENQEQRLRMMDPIAAPDVEPGRVLESAHKSPKNTAYSINFRFVNMEGARCMLNTHSSKSVKYCTWVTTLMFLLGFNYTLLIALNSEIPIIASPTLTQLVNIRLANFGGKIFSPLLGLWVLHHIGFKATSVTGLGIYCIGMLMFWPSGALNSYTSFVVSNFVVGFSQSLVDMATTTFLALCGPPLIR
jgi:hypothetical protein